MVVTRRLLCATSCVAWLIVLLFLGRSFFALTLIMSILLGVIAVFDITMLGVVVRMSINQRSQPIQWLSVAALMPRDGHVVNEDNDVLGVILEVTDLRLKEAEIAI